MTPSPLLTARESDGFVFEVAKCRWHPLCVFPAGAHWDAAKDEWWVSLGVNDSWCELLTLNGPELSRFLVAPKWLAPVAKPWQHRTEIINDMGLGEAAVGASASTSHQSFEGCSARAYAWGVEVIRVAEPFKPD
jgi:hypothetical protein